MGLAHLGDVGVPGLAFFVAGFPLVLPANFWVGRHFLGHHCVELGRPFGFLGFAPGPSRFPGLLLCWCFCFVLVDCCL